MSEMLDIETTLFSTPQALYSACVARPSTEMPTARQMLCEALDEKMARMREGRNGEKLGLSPQNEAHGKRWQREIRNGMHDSTLRVMLTVGTPLSFFLRKVREGSGTFNFYAIPKTFKVANAMLSSRPLWGNVGEGATLRGTILSVLRPDMNGVPHSVYLNDYMNDWKARGYVKPRDNPYTSGGTQSSSSAHALSAMGLVDVKGKGAYIVKHDLARQVLRLLVGEEAQE